MPIIRGCTNSPVRHPAVLQAVRPAAIDSCKLVVLLELIDDVAAVVQRINAQVVRAGQTAGPARIEGIEEPIDKEIALIAVAVHRVERLHPDAAAFDIRVLDAELRRRAVDVGTAAGRDGRAVAECIELLHLKADAVRTTAAAVGESGIQGPHIARFDEHVHAPVVIGDRPD